MGHRNPRGVHCSCRHRGPVRRKRAPPQFRGQPGWGVSTKRHGRGRGFTPRISSLSSPYCSSRSAQRRPTTSTSRAGPLPKRCSKVTLRSEGSTLSFGTAGSSMRFTIASSSTEPSGLQHSWPMTSRTPGTASCTATFRCCSRNAPSACCIACGRRPRSSCTTSRMYLSYSSYS